MNIQLTLEAKRRFFLLFILASALLTGCAVNPVTGKQEIMLISEQQELDIGAEQYEPAQQSQGGLYTLDPELTFYVKDVGRKLAEVSDRPDLPYEFVVLNNSVPNAWALPSGKIAINRGLLVQLEDEAQLAAVLGHEIVHAAARHSAKRLQSNLLISATVAGLGLALDTEYKDILVGGAALGAGLALAKYGRDHELESDHYGMRYMVKAGYDPQAAVELQQLFVKLSEGRSQSWLDGLFASHPPSPDRVEANRLTLNSLPHASFRGKDQYQRATARIRRTIPAYEAYEDGLKLLSKEDYEGALLKANQALKIEPDEALFYSLRGDVFKAQGKTQQAENSYQKAVSLNPEYFAHQLKLGMLQKEQGQQSQALTSLQRANALLPTSVAYLAMGDIEQDRNNTQAAMDLYQNAAESSGAQGQEAREKFARLDLPRNPDKYLIVETLRDRQNRGFLTINNRSVVTIDSASVEVMLVNSSGWVLKKDSLSFRNIAPGSQAQPQFSDLATEALTNKGVRLITQVTEYRAR